jgi:hypothetical protein
LQIVSANEAAVKISVSVHGKRSNQGWKDVTPPC